MKRQRRKEQKIYRRRKALRKKRANRRFILNALPKSERSFETGKIGSINSRLLTLNVPHDFSTSEALDDVLYFIGKCKAAGVKKRRIIQINFEKVNNVNAGALSLLLSVIQDLDDLNIRIRGNMPNNMIARNAFIDSGFLEYVHNEQGLKHNSKNKIIVKGQHKVDQRRTGMEVKKAMNTVFGNENHLPPLQGALIEMMANSLNHAFPAGTADSSNYYQAFISNKRWYFSAFHHEASHEVHFSFIDNGVGILNTIRKGKFQKAVDKLSDADVLRNAFDGKYRSSTKHVERGKGLPTVKRAHDLKSISNLKVVTNNQLYDFDNQRYTKLTNGFDGTCYFWKLDKQCKYAKIED